MRCLLVILLLHIFPIRQAFGQTRWLDVSNNAGFAAQAVYCIVEDPEGYIWLGTSQGLLRYDGHQTKLIPFSYSPLTGNSVQRMKRIGDYLFFTVGGSRLMRIHYRSLDAEVVLEGELTPRSTIADLQVNSHGQLLAVRTNGHAYWFDTKRSAPIKHQYLKLAKDYVHCIAERANWLLVAGRVSGVQIANADGSLSNIIREDSWPYPSYCLESICPVNDTCFALAGWDNMVTLFNPANQRRYSYPFDGSQTADYNGNEAVSMSLVDPNTLWIGSKRNGVYEFNLRTQKSRWLNLEGFKGRRVNAIFCDSKGRRWVGTDKGLNLWVESLQHFELLELEQVEKHGINTIGGFNNLVFVGTQEGLISLDPLTGKQQFYKIILEEKPLEVHSVLGIKRNEIYVGTNRALLTLNLLNGQYGYTIPNSVIQADSTHCFNPNLLVSSRYSHLVADTSTNEPQIWAATQGLGILQYNTLKKTLQTGLVRKKNSSLPGYLVSAMHFDSADDLWIGCRENGYFGKLRFIRHIYPAKISNTRGDSIGVRLWPLPVYESEHHWTANSNGLMNGRVLCVAPRNGDSFWIGTDGGGVYYFNLNKTPQFIRVIPAIERPEALHEDKFGRLWILEAGMLKMVDFKERKLLSFGVEFGLPTNELKAPFFSAEDGFLYLAAERKLVRFLPENIQTKTTNTSLKFTGYALLNSPIQSIPNKEAIRIHESNPVFSVYFSAFLFSRANHIQYRYRLENTNNSWVDAGNKHFVTFSLLPAGKHRLEVQAYDSNGNILSEIGTLEFYIVPYWYKTTWFLVSLVAMLLGLTVLAYRYRIRQLIRVQRVRDQIARDLHDDIGSALGAINIFTHAAQQNIEQKNTTKAYSIIHEIGNYSREIAEHMGDIIWAVNPQNDDLIHLIDRVQNYAQQLLSPAGISLIFESDPQTQNLQLEMRVRRAVYLIIKEALNNSLKYADCREILIQFLMIDGKLNVCISDDGKGFNTGQHQTMNGNGLLNMKHRAEEINAEINIESNLGKGCRIQLIIP